MYDGVHPNISCLGRKPWAVDGVSLSVRAMNGSKVGHLLERCPGNVAVLSSEPTDLLMASVTPFALGVYEGVRDLRTFNTRQKRCIKAASTSLPASECKL